MASFATTIPLLFFCLLLSKGEANNSVIDYICEKSIDPNFCLKHSVQFDPRFAVGDLPSISLAFVSLTTVNVKLTQSLLTTALAKQPPVDPALKPKYEQCLTAYNQSIENLDKAKPNIESRNYKAFAEVANKALQGAETCEDSLVGSPADPEIAASNGDSLKLCNIVFTCADQLQA